MGLIERMTKTRIDRKMTQLQLADRLGVKQAMVSMLESGEEPLSDGLASRIKGWIDSGAGPRLKSPRGPRGNYRKRKTVP